MPPDQAKEHADKAGDEVKLQQKEISKQIKSKKKEEKTSQVAVDPSSIPNELVVKTHSQQWFTMVAEEMIHISRYQVTLRKVSEKCFDMDLECVEMCITKVNDSSSLVTVRAENGISVFSALFPRLLQNGRMQLVEDTATLQLSLPYQDDPTAHDLVLPRTLTPIEQINSIRCGSCQWPLLPAEKAIERTAELPVGHWDEIADYLICYNGVSGQWNNAFCAF